MSDTGLLKLIVTAGSAELAEAAASLVRARLDAKPDLVMAVPAGRTPRPMYARLRELQERAPVDYSRMRVFCVDELCPPAPPDGYFWRQITGEFLAWAGIPGAHCHPFRVDADDLHAMCRAYEATIGDAGGLDLVMLGLGPNAHLASNEPGTPFDSATRPVPLLAETVRYILTDEIIQGPVSPRAVTLGLATIMAAREVVVLVSGEGKTSAAAPAPQGDRGAGGSGLDPPRASQLHDPRGSRRVPGLMRWATPYLGALTRYDHYRYG